MARNALHDRLIEIAGDQSYRSLGEITGIHPESVRRYMQGQTPSLEFVATLCAELGISADWVLMGRGPKFSDAAVTEAIATATTSDLLGALARLIDDLDARLTRLETVPPDVRRREAS